MALSDQQTALLPPRRQPGPPDPGQPRPGVLFAVLAVVLVALAVTALATAEAISRAESQRTIASMVRAALELPDSQRIDVDIEGFALLQQPFGRFDGAHATVRSFPTGPATSDLTFDMEGLRGGDGDWTLDGLSGALTLTAAQATALFVPAEARGAVRVGFSGDDVVFDVSLPGGMGTQTGSVAMTPRFEKGRVSAGVSSVTVGGKVLSVEEVTALTGGDLAALQVEPLCFAELLPRALHVSDVAVSEQRFRVELDIDLATFDTAAGSEPGSCP